MKASKRGAAKPAARRDGNRELLSLLRRMWVIRAFEEKVSALYAAREIVGLLHLGIGQEAVAVGVCGLLDTDDVVYGGHRSHGHAIAKGADVNRLMAELAGRVTGYCRGKGGSMHVVAAETGFVTASGVVGGTVPLALGAAFAARERGRRARSGGVLRRRRRPDRSLPRVAEHRQPVAAPGDLRVREQRLRRVHAALRAHQGGAAGAARRHLRHPQRHRGRQRHPGGAQGHGPGRGQRPRGQGADLCRVPDLPAPRDTTRATPASTGSFRSWRTGRRRTPSPASRGC